MGQLIFLYFLRYEVFVPRKDGKVNLDDPSGKVSFLQGGSYSVSIKRGPVSPTANQDDVSDSLIMRIRTVLGKKR